MRQVVALVLGLVLVGQSTVGGATQLGSDESVLERISYRTGSVVGSAVYLPLKAAYCFVGAFTSSLTLIFAGPETANAVISATCLGTWAITPNVLKDKEPVQFVGDVPAPEGATRQESITLEEISSSAP